MTITGGSRQLAGLLACWLLLVTMAAAQQRAQDRRTSLGPGQRVSDDPRRVPVPPEPAGPKPTVVLRGGRIVDGTGTAARLGTVVITGNRISAILPAGSSEWPADARILDVAGKTVLPGLIDLHTHLSYRAGGVPPYEDASDADGSLRGVERLRYYIESGITSVRDTGSRGDVPFRLKAWVREHRLPGPRVFPAGQVISATGGHGSESFERVPTMDSQSIAVSGPDAWREEVRRQFKRGADFIKITSHFSRGEVAAAVEEAHALGLKITCDCETFYIQWAVEAGVDSIEHPLPRTDETIQLMAKRGVASVPTLVPYIIIFDVSGGYFNSTSRRFGFSKEENVHVVRRMRRAGVKAGVGTDLVGDWFRFLPFPYITELKQFVAAGDTVLEALVRATRTSAEILDMDDKLGTLEPGKLADVIVIAGRPDQNLDDLARVETVIRDGEVVVVDGKVVIPRHVPVPMPKAGGARP